jgi:dihydroorotate dehydrogenase electron transfer subunit
VSAEPARSHRGTIFLEEAEVVAHEAFEAEQHVIRLRAPRCAAAAVPGSFVHLTCGPGIPMRRPLSIMRANAREGWIDILYKVVGAGLQSLAARRVGERLSTLGPIGTGFSPHRDRRRALLLGGGVGIPPMVFLAEWLAADHAGHWQPLVMMGSEVPFPFRARPSTILVPGLPEGTIACMPMLDGWGVPSRLASLAGFPGCYEGYVTGLGEEWLRSLGSAMLAEVEIFACGPTPMLKACADLARRFGVPCQVSLEEFMACAVGGCAGCTVLVQTPQGPAMKRVCVDGPVFDAESVFPTAA